MTHAIKKRATLIKDNVIASLSNIKYKLFGIPKDRKIRKAVQFTEVTYEELKNFQRNLCPYDKIFIEVPCPYKPGIFHKSSLRTARHSDDERDFQTWSHHIRTPGWANYFHETVQPPKSYGFSTILKSGEEVFLVFEYMNYYASIPAKGIQKVLVTDGGYEYDYLKFDFKQREYIIPVSRELKKWLIETTGRAHMCLDHVTEDKVQEAGGKKLALYINGVGMIVNIIRDITFIGDRLKGYPQGFEPHYITEFLSYDLNLELPTVRQILDEKVARKRPDVWGGGMALEITPEERNKIFEEEEKNGTPVTLT